MGVDIVERIVLTGSDSYSLKAGDLITLSVKGDSVLHYTIPEGKKGTIQIVIDGTVEEDIG